MDVKIHLFVNQDHWIFIIYYLLLFVYVFVDLAVRVFENVAVLLELSSLPISRGHIKSTCLLTYLFNFHLSQTSGQSLILRHAYVYSQTFLDLYEFMQILGTSH